VPELNDQERDEIIEAIRAGRSLPARYRASLFDDALETELIWPGKTTDVERVVLPFQSIEHIDEPRSGTVKQPDLFSFSEMSGRQIGGWTNKLIWGDNKLILSSLVNGPLRKQIEEAGGLQLVYIDPPFDVGADWTPGLYMVASVGPTGSFENIAPFILRSTSSDSKLLLVHSTLTWAAYNSFGGHSTYSAPIAGEDERSKISSLDRPYAGSGISHIERDALSFVQYLESTGLNIDQVSDVDLNNSPSIVSQYGGLIFSGHPEYMTRTEFNTIAAARNMGIKVEE
jgi:hypothetical protein